MRLTIPLSLPHSLLIGLLTITLCGCGGGGSTTISPAATLVSPITATGDKSVTVLPDQTYQTPEGKILPRYTLLNKSKLHITCHIQSTFALKSDPEVALTDAGSLNLDKIIVRGQFLHLSVNSGDPTLYEGDISYAFVQVNVKDGVKTVLLRAVDVQGNVVEQALGDIYFARRS